jgi:hypothetical protein
MSGNKLDRRTIMGLGAMGAAIAAASPALADARGKGGSKKAPRG